MKEITRKTDVNPGNINLDKIKKVNRSVLHGDARLTDPDSINVVEKHIKSLDFTDRESGVDKAFSDQIKQYILLLYIKLGYISGITTVSDARQALTNNPTFFDEQGDDSISRDYQILRKLICNY